MLSVSNKPIMLSVVMLSVMAPFQSIGPWLKHRTSSPNNVYFYIDHRRKLKFSI